jgi:solute carrier family 8 (sodium/calcium exchanger)
MAMGSSMPEIFLNIIEIMFNKFETGALGPGTILDQNNTTKTLVGH